MKKNSPAKKTRQIDYARTSDMLIRRLLSDKDKYKFRFTTYRKAVNYLQKFRKSFIVSATKEDEPKNDAELTLWVRFYKHTFPGEERSAIPKGEFLKITIKEDEVNKGIFIYHYEVLNIDPRFHPSRGYKLKTQPNWGFFILRDFKKRKAYKDKEEIWHEFERLEAFFPKVTIRPEQDTLYCKVFEKSENQKISVPSYIFEIIEIHDDGRAKFTVNIKKNTFKRVYTVGQRIYYSGL